MKRFAAFIALFLLAMPSGYAARENKTYTEEVNGFIISVEDTGASVRVQVRSTQPYGVTLHTSKSRNSYSHMNRENVRHLTAVFRVKEVKPGEALKPSTVYYKKVGKGMKNKIFLTVRTDDVLNIEERMIWSRY